MWGFRVGESRLLRIRRRLSFVRRVVDQLDPCGVPGAERVSLAFVGCFIAVAAFVIWQYATYLYVPDMDAPYHVFCMRVMAEWGKPNFYTDLYEPVNRLDANTLLYTVGVVLMKVMPPVRAFRTVQLYWMLGVPLVALWGLRRFGRSPWGSLLAFPLLYTECYAYGYENFLFAAPTFLIALVVFWEYLERATLVRGAAITTLMVLVFVSHVHAFLWLGVLLVVLTVWAMSRRFVRESPRGFRAAALAALRGGLLALVAVLPSLVVFKGWYDRTYGQALSTASTSKTELASYGATWMPIFAKASQGLMQAFIATDHPTEVYYLVALEVLLVVALILRRTPVGARPAIFEVCLVLSAVSYFVLPDGLTGQLVAGRHWYVAGWLVPFVVWPPQRKTAAVGRMIVIGAILAFTTARMRVLWQCLDSFNEEEMEGFREIIRYAPSDARTLAFAAVNNKSKYWIGTSIYHSYGYLAAIRGYEAPYNDFGSGSVSPVRYRDHIPLPMTHIYSDRDWYRSATAWSYDLILVRGWSDATVEQRAEASKFGSLLVRAGDWELWRSRAPR